MRRFRFGSGRARERVGFRLPLTHTPQVDVRADPYRGSAMVMVPPFLFLPALAMLFSLVLFCTLGAASARRAFARAAGAGRRLAENGRRDEEKADEEKSFHRFDSVKAFPKRRLKHLSVSSGKETHLALVKRRCFTVETHE